MTLHFLINFALEEFLKTKRMKWMWSDTKVNIQSSESIWYQLYEIGATPQFVKIETADWYRAEFHKDRLWGRSCRGVQERVIRKHLQITPFETLQPCVSCVTDNLNKNVVQNPDSTLFLRISITWIWPGSEVWWSARAWPTRASSRRSANSSCRQSTKLLGRGTMLAAKCRGK